MNGAYYTNFCSIICIIQFFFLPLCQLIKQLKKDVKTYSIRVSKVIGEHNLRFFAEDEEITITHKITSRDVFAKGILLAIDFLKNKDNGFYTMEDIINEI